MSASFFKKKRNEIKIRVSNLLNDDALHTYKSFQANDEVFSKYLPGFSISIGLTFNL